MIGKLTAVFCVSLMSSIHLMCESTGSTDRAMALTPRLANSSLSLAVKPSSVVHTGVKSAGWEKRMPQLSSCHSWKRMRPSLESCSKSGAISPRRILMIVLLGSSLLRGDHYVQEQRETKRINNDLFITETSLKKDRHDHTKPAQGPRRTGADGAAAGSRPQHHRHRRLSAGRSLHSRTPGRGDRRRLCDPGPDRRHLGTDEHRRGARTPGPGHRRPAAAPRHRPGPTIGWETPGTGHRQLRPPTDLLPARRLSRGGRGAGLLPAALSRTAVRERPAASRPLAPGA